MMNNSTDLFGLPKDIEAMRPKLADLSRQNVFLGTSSWKYEGWLGHLYAHGNYLQRNKFSKKKFTNECLREYATFFKTVSLDATYYAFPTKPQMTSLRECVGNDFKFGFKVTNAITIKHFPNLPEYGNKKGQSNELFLNVDAFMRGFLEPLAGFKPMVGVIMFEFSQFATSEFEQENQFFDLLDGFLEKLPGDFSYAIEVRNQSFLTKDYFSVLKKHGVAHLYNNWDRMPPVSEQLVIDSSMTTDFAAARFLLTPGRKYAKAVEEFSPYRETRVIDENARKAARDLIEKARRLSKRPSFIFVNNRLEGNAIKTIEAMMA